MTHLSQFQIVQKNPLQQLQALIDENNEAHRKIDDLSKQLLNCQEKINELEKSNVRLNSLCFQRYNALIGWIRIITNPQQEVAAQSSSSSPNVHLTTFTLEQLFRQVCFSQSLPAAPQTTPPPAQSNEEQPPQQQAVQQSSLPVRNSEEILTTQTSKVTRSYASSKQHKISSKRPRSDQQQRKNEGKKRERLNNS